MSSDIRKVGIVGTGEMGRPLVDRLVEAGFEVAAYVRRPEVGQEAIPVKAGDPRLAGVQAGIAPERCGLQPMEHRHH